MFQMIKEISQVLVFKTNIGINDKERVLDYLRAQNFIRDVSIDTEDCDCVLRVVGEELQNDVIINLVKSQGFHCEELN